MKGEKIRLRAMEPDDADLMYVWENDPLTWEAGYRKWPISHNDIETLISHSDLDIWQTRQTRLMIETTKDKQTVGCIDIIDFDPQNRHASLGLYVEHRHRRKGYATEALHLIEEFARKTLQIVTLHADVSEDNAGSLRAFEKSGYKPVGRLEKWIRDGESYKDQIVLQKVL